MGDMVHLKKGTMVSTGFSNWSDPVRVIEVFRNAVRVDGGGVWNLNSVIVQG